MNARIRPATPAFLLLLLAGGLPAGVLPAMAQDNPMAIRTFPVEDDEPEAATEPPEAGQPTSAERLRLVTAPRPPQRPWSAPAAPARPEAGQSVAVVAPVPPRRPGPAQPEPEDSPAEPPAPEASPAPDAAARPALVPAAGPKAPVLEPDHRLVSLPTTAQPTTTEEIEAEEERAPEPMLVEKQTDAVSIACLQPEVLRLVRIAGEHFGATPVITSGQRDRGRRGSYHRKCMAADFFVPGIERARLAKYLRTLPGAGGVGTYCHTKSVHIDTGEPRNWWQCGFRFRFAQR